MYYLGHAPTTSNGMSRGPDDGLGAIKLRPNNEGVAVCVDVELWCARAPGVVAFDEFGSTPISANHTAVGPNIVASAIGLVPHDDGVTVRMDGDLRRERFVGCVSL